MTNPTKSLLSEVLLSLLPSPVEPEGTEEDEDKAVRALRRLADPLAFEHLIERLIEDEEFLAQVAASSYHHVLGFDKLLLMSAAPFGRLRMHVWWPKSSLRPVEHPHNHRFSSHSVVVTGKLRTHVFNPGAVGVLASHYQERAIPGEMCSQFVRMGQTHLSAIMSADIAAGATYSMSADIVHRVETPQELTVTMFLEMARVRSSSDIFVGEGDPIPRGQARRHFSVVEVRDILGRLLVTA